MNPRNFSDLQIPAATTIAYTSIAKWCAMTGMSRSRTYLELGRKNLCAVKLGRRILINVESGLTWLASQPTAEIRAPREVQS